MDRLQIGGSSDLLLRFCRFARASHGTRGNTLLKDLIKDNEPTAQWRDASGEVWGKGRGSSVPSPVVPLAPHLPVFSSLEDVQTQSFRVFMEASLHNHGQVLGCWLIQPATLPHSPEVAVWD